MNNRKQMSFMLTGALVVVALTMVAFNAAPAAPADSNLAAPVKRTPTPTRKPTPTATKPPPKGFLRRQLFFALGGGGLFCSSIIAPDMALPAVSREAPSEAGNEERICVYGFEAGERVTIKIYDPAKRLIASIPLVIRDDDPFGYNFPVNSAYLSPLPNHAPHGRWRVVVEAPSGRAENNFDHPGNYPSLTPNRDAPAIAGWYDPRRMPSFKVGDTVLVQGANQPTDRNLVLAIYRVQGDANLMTGQVVYSDRNGNFQAGFPLTGDFKPDNYFAVVVDDQNQDTYSLDDVLARVPVYSSEKVCQSAPPSMLKKGDTVLVTAGAPNNVREKPGLNSRLIGKLYEYEAAEILLGPKCADNMVWWKVTSLNTGMDGWTAEGRDGDNWLVLYRRF